MNNTHIPKNFSSLRITNRIALMYGTVMAVLIFLTTTVTASAVPIIYNNVVSREINFSYQNVCNYISSAVSLTTEDIDEAINDNYIDFIITDSVTGKIYKQVSSNGVLNKDTHQFSFDDNFISLNSQPNINISSSVANDSGQKFMVARCLYTYNGTEYIMLFSKPLVDMGSFTDWIGFRVTIILAVSIIFSSLAGGYLSFVLLRPIKEISRAAKKISDDNDLSERLVISGPDDELRELSQTFNDMLDKLEKSFNRQKNFTSDVSHELKTPIAIINGYVELIDRWGKNDPEVLQESIDSIKTEIKSMTELINSLLFIARFDNDTIVLHPTKLNLNDTLKKITNNYSVMATKREIIFEKNENPIFIWADEVHVEQLIRIFIDNAIKYTGSDGRIAVKAYCDEEYGYISVSDNGKGITPEELPYIFDRFYRADKSRNKKIDGSGLGLAIASYIVKSHKGKIWVESNAGKGSIFTAGFKLYKE